jgi:hypothetical protein
MSKNGLAIGRRPVLSTSSLWFGALAGHVAWTAQLLLTYFVVSLACSVRPAGSPILGLNVAQPLMLGLTVLPAVVAVAATILAFLGWRAAGPDAQARESGADGWRGFMGLFGALLSGLFVALILVTGVSLLVVRPCA